MTSLEITPYAGVGPFRFGMTEAEVAALELPPLRKTKNTLGEPNWDYDLCSVRFGATDGRLCELGFSRQSDISLRGVSLFSDPTAFAQLLTWDESIYEFYGFLIFFELGLALTGFHDNCESDKALTVFPRGRWDRFRTRPRFRKWG